MDLEAIFKEIDNKIKQLENKNQKLREENRRLNKELDEYCGEKIDDFKLKQIHKSSELISAIEERYKNAGMKVTLCKPNSHNNTTFKLEFGNWTWDGKVKFIGKQYFRTKRFSDGNCDGYDDPEKFICELLGIKSLGFGGIASKWYRQDIPIPEGFIFDETVG